MKLVVASSNQSKIAELASLLSGEVELLSLADLRLDSPVEDGATLLENALIKARAAAAATGLAAIADDSGLEVDAIDGAPGVRSARYAGPEADDADNNAKLLTALNGVPAAERGARFRSAVALVLPDKVELTACGAVEGRIGLVPRGEHGFGYDPLFELDDPNAVDYEDKTMAELTTTDKNRISHRGRAYRNLLAAIDAQSAQYPELSTLIADREWEKSS